MKHYPSWRYHKTHQPVIVKNQAQHDKLEAEGWAESPADFEEKSEREETPKEKLDRELAELEGETPPEEDLSESDAGEELSAEDMRAILIERGLTKKELKGKTNEELTILLAA